MDKLKPCPFCGGEVIFKDGYQCEDGTWVHGFVRCEKCGTKKKSVHLSDFLGTWRHGFVSDEVAHECSLTAIEAWNTRHENTCHPKDKGEHLSGTDCPAWECSKCGELFEAGANFCSNCGARVIS